MAGVPVRRTMSVAIRRRLSRRIAASSRTISVGRLARTVVRGMPGGTAVPGRARGSRLQHLHPGGVPLEGHVLVVCRFDQDAIANLREHSLANVLVEEHFLVDETEIVLDLGNMTGSTEDPLIRVELGRTLADLGGLLGLRLVLESERVDRTRRRILHGLRVDLLLLQTHLRNQRQVLLLLKPCEKGTK